MEDFQCSGDFKLQKKITWSRLYLNCPSFANFHYLAVSFFMVSLSFMCLMWFYVTRNLLKTCGYYLRSYLIKLIISEWVENVLLKIGVKYLYLYFDNCENSHYNTCEILNLAVRYWQETMSMETWKMYTDRRLIF
jgi:hypothetical protein